MNINNERLTRLLPIYGPINLSKVINSTVCIVGLGGVGSSACLTLARSGVNNFIIVDFDKVNLSNCNRQHIAFTSTVGMFKTDCMEKMILDINPEANIIKITSKFSEEVDLFKYNFSYLIDAIDDINNKYLLIKKCIENKITFISSMGTARKNDLDKLKVIEIQKTSYDPIAKILRKRLRDDKIYNKVWVVSSTEEPNKQDSKELGSYMPVTTMAGLLLADYIIKQIIKGDN